MIILILQAAKIEMWLVAYKNTTSKKFYAGLKLKPIQNYG
jgi:hypothetical protein